MDELNVTPETQEEKQEYIDEMVAKADKANEDPNNTSEEETQAEKLLAGKYKTEEDLQKGILEALQKQNDGKDLEAIYKDLESSLGAPKNETEDTPTEESTEDAETDAEETTTEEEDTLNDDNDLDFAKYEQELYDNNGSLTDESYKELEEKGYPRNLVDTYIRGLQAAAQEEASAVYEVTDGEDNYKAMIEWAQDNLSGEEIKAFNQQVNAGVNSAKFAAEALYGRYTKANGTPPKNLVHGDAPNTVGNDAYESREQLMEDIGNPKYKTDPAFRKKVEQKLSRSDVF
jgi:hypothetical protein